MVPVARSGLAVEGETQMKKRLTGCALAFALVGACTNAPVSNNEAARRAAQCLEWPNAVLDRVSTLSPPGPAPGDGMVLAYRNAGRVLVSPAGECLETERLMIFSGNLIRNLPQHSITVVNDRQGDHNGVYILLLNEVDSEGRRLFYGMRGGVVEVEIPPDRGI